jgi:hypothetical protein
LLRARVGKNQQKYRERQQPEISRKESYHRGASSRFWRWAASLIAAGGIHHPVMNVALGQGVY